MNITRKATIIDTLIALAILFAITPNAQSLEISLYAGLHVTHFNRSTYYDYTTEPTESRITFRDGEAVWVDTYDERKLNEGFGQNDLVGVRLSHESWAVSLLTYKNSFYERSNGLSVAYTFANTQFLRAEAGAVVLTGYRPALVHGRTSTEDMSQKPMLAPLISVIGTITDNIEASYTIMSGKVGVLTISQKVF